MLTLITSVHMSTSVHTHTHTHTYYYVYMHMHTEPSLTLDTLSSVLDGVQRLVDFGGVCAWLQIPRSKQDELEQQCDRRQLPRASSTVFLTENPYRSILEDRCSCFMGEWRTRSTGNSSEIVSQR